MKSIPKSKRSRSRREKHALSDDSSDSEKNSSFQSSTSGDSVSSSDSSSEGEGYRTFQKGLYAMMKKARELKKRQAKLSQVKTDRGDPGFGGDSSSFDGRKERRVKVKKFKNPSVVRRAKFKRAKDGDSDSDGVSV